MMRAHRDLSMIDTMRFRLQKFLTSRDIDDAYEIGGVLGRGAYSVVKTAKAKKTNDEVRREMRRDQTRHETSMRSY